MHHTKNHNHYHYQELTSLSEETWSAIKHRFASSSNSLELDELEEELESLSSHFFFLTMHIARVS